MLASLVVAGNRACAATEPGAFWRESCFGARHLFVPACRHRDSVAVNCIIVQVLNEGHPVPLPGAMWLFGFGIVVVWRIGRSKITPERLS